ncbi:MAG: hypothetical protein EXX96DRAFT_604174 [Benjaminiella poitrasii]|nr:MAG: hypothetical protein EXX96DRAFT_604174 [Benjaminiella poitrasii]
MLLFSFLCLCKHPLFQTYASKVERYLKTPSIKKQFEALYNDKCDEDKIEKNKRRLKRQTRQLYSAPKLISLPTTSSAKIEITNIKDIIFDHANELHHLHQRGDDSSTEQLEAMSKGLPCILDLDNLKDTNEKAFDFYEDILNLVESKEFMLNTANALKISEGDYVYQVWLPLLSKLFNINKNIEFDLVCGEGCLRGATNKKISSDKSKLAREGNEAKVALQKIYNSTDNDSIKSKAWLCQYVGLKCIFSTIHATKHQYHAIIPEFSLSFPTSFLSSDGINSIKCLFSLRDSVETAALDIKKSSIKTKKGLLQQITPVDAYLSLLKD